MLATRSSPNSPGWPTIVEQIKLADAEPVIVRTAREEGFQVRVDAVLSAITPRTRGIILNSPGNPTGALVTEEDLTALADEVASRGLWILVDLCYEQLIYDRGPHNLPKILVDRMRDRTVVMGTVSKTYAMTGWRCGWVLGPAPVVAACNAIQSHSTSNVCSITQKAAVAAAHGPSGMRDRHARRVSSASRHARRVAVSGDEDPIGQAGGGLLSVPGYLGAVVSRTGFARRGTSHGRC